MTKQQQKEQKLFPYEVLIKAGLKDTKENQKKYQKGMLRLLLSFQHSINTIK